MDEKVRSLLLAPNFAHIATVRRDGSAAVSPVWVDLKGDLVLVNGATRRAWPRNLIRDRRVTISVSALANPYECATLRGHALDPTTDDAEDHFHQLCEKYRGRPIPTNVDLPPNIELVSRLLFRVVVESVRYRYEPPPDATDEFDAFLAG